MIGEFFGMRISMRLIDGTATKETVVSTESVNMRVGGDRSAGSVTYHYVLYTLAVLMVYGFLWLFWRNRMLMDFDDLWQPDADIGAALADVWFIFVWGAALSLLVGLLSIVTRSERQAEPGEVFFSGLWVSLHAGFFEEILWRWLIFFSAMVTLPFLSWCTFGLLELAYTEVLVPLANWATFGALEPQLLGHSTWVFGAALVSANSSFRDQHKYLGPFSFVNAWFVGMVFFWLMFHHGLMSAIVAHALYDICVFTTRAFMANFQPSAYSLPSRVAQRPRLSARSVELDWEHRTRGID